MSAEQTDGPSSYAEERSHHEPVDVGLRKQLLIDDYAIASKSKVERRLGKVTRENNGEPVMKPDEPWESIRHFGFYSSALRVDGKFRMWYFSQVYADVGYAESDDGFHWTKPRVGDNGENNIVFQGHGFSCFLDPHETDPDHRYKAAYGPDIHRLRETVGGPEAKARKAAHLAHSPDGIRWTPYNEGRPVISREPRMIGDCRVVTAADTHSQILWDPDAQLYRLFTRDLFIGPAPNISRDPDGGLFARDTFGAQEPGEAEKVSRASRTMTNPDVKADPTNWTLVRTWEFDREGPDEYRRRQIYALTDWIYEGVHFAMVKVFIAGGFIDFYIATSRDGAHWDLSWIYAGERMIPGGLEGSFDRAGASPFAQPVTWQDRHWLYYGGMSKGHKNEDDQMAIGLATLRLDGFVSLSAADEPGTITTRPFKVEGRQLELNIDASQGQVSVEILDAAERPIPGFARQDCRSSERIDELRFQPRWENQAGIAALEGQVVRLGIHLHNAHLYAFQITQRDGD
jgi:hypothetical protein